MTAIKNLAKSRIRLNKSRTILTAVAILLTTTLLMGVGTTAVGLFDSSRQQAVFHGNYHATFSHLTKEQVNQLQNHNLVEALETDEIFATVERGKMNSFLVFHDVLKEGIYHGMGNLVEGLKAQEDDEIYGPKAFFERMGVEPVIGNQVSISFRVGESSRMETRKFTICGITSQIDVSSLTLNDARIAYSANVSEALVNAYIPDDQRSYNVNLRVTGENQLNYDEIKDIIYETAADIECDKSQVNLNQEYLITGTRLGTEMKMIVVGISLMILLFSGLVIYSIYYVCVITDVQEIGKLKAIGASDRQVKQMFLTEGFSISLLAVPCGLILGYFIPYIALPILYQNVMKVNPAVCEMEKIHMFSLPVVLSVAVAVFITVYFSLRKPMKMASKVSPVEAIRYQESSSRRKARKGYKNVDVFRLSVANLVQNRKRTIVTILTMGLSCVLFMSLAGTMNSMSTEDLARRNIKKGSFRLSIDFTCNDQEYPENNLDRLSMQNLFDDTLIEEIHQIDGVEDIEREGCVLIGADFPCELFKEGGRTSLSWFEREDVKLFQNSLKVGSIDYDSMRSEKGAILTTAFYEKYGLYPGMMISATVYDGDRQFPLDIKLDAISPNGTDYMFLIPKEVYDSLELQYDSTVNLYVFVEPHKYEEVKNALTKIADAQEYFRLYSLDEEMTLGRMGVSIVKYPLYLILILVAVIGFMNLMNTMITSVVTRKRELGVLQAIGLSKHQLTKMLAGEGMVFTVGTLIASVTIGNLFGYLIFLWAKSTGFMSISNYHYPIYETIGLAVFLVLGQVFVTHFMKWQIGKESLMDTIRNNE